MLDIGIIGLGPDWESRYRSILLKLRDRIRVRALYDSVSSRAEVAAAELGTQVSHGIQSLIARHDVRAILVLDAVWYGHIPLQFACLHGKPSYIVGGLGECLNAVKTLQHQVADQGIDMMPEFRQRYTPATCRLRELMATRLGRPKHIRIEATYVPPADREANWGQGSETDFLVGLMDWCHYLVGSHPLAIRSDPRSSREVSPDAKWEIRELILEYQRREANGEPVVAELLLFHRHPDELNHHQNPGPPRCEASCLEGSATIEGSTKLTWEHAGEKRLEVLDAERPAIEVMLDHFCRRVVGGLIPVPNIEDVYRSLNLVHAAQESIRKGDAIRVA